MKYHKIQSVFKKEEIDKNRKLINGQFTIPEFEYLKNNIWIFTEKVDGINVRVLWNKEKILFKGRTDNSMLPLELINRLSLLFLPFIDLFQKLFGNKKACLYGEGYGGKIQKGEKYKTFEDFVLLDIQIENWWLKREDIQKIALEFNIDIVPIIGQGTLWDMVDYTKLGFKSYWGDFIAEGIVARPFVELQARNGKRIITKVKYQDF